jgi:hypothetical protein
MRDGVAQANAERLEEYNRALREANREKKRAQDRRYRARKRADPEYRERRRAQDRRYRERRRARISDALLDSQPPDFTS